MGGSNLGDSGSDYGSAKSRVGELECGLEPDANPNELRVGEGGRGNRRRRMKGRAMEGRGWEESKGGVHGPEDVSGQALHEGPEDEDDRDRGSPHGFPSSKHFAARELLAVDLNGDGRVDACLAYEGRGEE